MSTVEFAIVGLAFITIVVGLLETAWQMAVGAGLEYGAREVSRWYAVGRPAEPPPTSVEPCPGEIRRIVVARTAGALLRCDRLTVNASNYGGWSDVGLVGRGSAGTGGGGAVVEYRLTYIAPPLTPLGQVLFRSQGLQHSTVFLVQNEPFPTAN